MRGRTASSRHFDRRTVLQDQFEGDVVQIYTEFDTFFWVIEGDAVVGLTYLVGGLAGCAGLLPLLPSLIRRVHGNGDVWQRG
jgi:hypothetical protein